MRYFPGLAVAVAAALALAAAPARAEPVDLQLVFINDVSGSVTPQDFSTFRQGYVRAFRDPALLEVIKRGRTGAIAVSLAFYSERYGGGVGWMKVHDAASANAFADAVAALPRPRLGIEDGLARAIRAATAAFREGGFEGARRVIDVVTEGADSVDCPSSMDCQPLRVARAAALDGGVTAINGLFLQDRTIFGNRRGDRINATEYGRRNLIAGPGSFSVFVDGIGGFGAAIRAKIEREIETPPPMPPLIECCH